jgi:hypothetical protein
MLRMRQVARSSTPKNNSEPRKAVPCSSQFFRDERVSAKCCPSLTRVLQIISPEQHTMKEKVAPRPARTPRRPTPPPYLFFEMLQMIFRNTYRLSMALKAAFS